MPPPQQTALAGVVLSAAIVAVAAALGLRQHRERRGRGPGLSEPDARHFARQDARRGVGLVIMLLLAVGLAVGSRVEPGAAGRANPLFVRIWLGVFVLIFALLALALLDWLATRRYALRQWRGFYRERSEALRDEFRRRDDRAGGDGHPGPFDGASP